MTASLLPISARAETTPEGVELCPLEVVPDGQARNFVLKVGDRRFHGFVVRRGEKVWGYVDRCPHAGLPLAKVLDDYLTTDGKLIACDWHGALFDIDAGVCVGGPCPGARLVPWPVSNELGRIVTGHGGLR